MHKNTSAVEGFHTISNDGIDLIVTLTMLNLTIMMTSVALTGPRDNQSDHDRPLQCECDNKILNIEYVPRFAIVLHCIYSFL